jgi:hypothetical protein
MGMSNPAVSTKKGVPMSDVRLMSCLKVVETNDLMAHEHQSVDKMTSHEPTSSRHKYPFLVCQRKIPIVSVTLMGGTEQQDIVDHQDT